MTKKTTGVKYIIAKFFICFTPAIVTAANDN